MTNLYYISNQVRRQVFFFVQQCRGELGKGA